jgi:hypothetical protein
MTVAKTAASAVAPTACSTMKMVAMFEDEGSPCPPELGQVSTGRDGSRGRLWTHQHRVRTWWSETWGSRLRSGVVDVDIIAASDWIDGLVPDAFCEVRICPGLEFRMPERGGG